MGERLYIYIYTRMPVGTYCALIPFSIQQLSESSEHASSSLWLYAVHIFRDLCILCMLYVRMRKYATN